ncbi:MAG: GNAT family N-acetyltransferase [Candidatus Marinimicrobia bacterium]|nr:GNAT family N-acetyltransferase [Candidatus Neomarinimicrobiota bacterium]
MTQIDGFEIREAVVDDLPLILRFIKDLAEYERMKDDVITTEEILKHSIFGEGSNTSVLLAFYNDEPVGFAIYFYNFSSFLGKKGIYLEDLFVQPDARGKGFGKALLIRLAEIARDEDCGRLEWAVLDWNEPAIDFYKNLGAVQMDEWTVFRLNREAIEILAGAN